MKKALFCIFTLFACVGVFAQQPIVAVATFDTSGGITSDEAQVVTELFITELVSTGKVSVVDRINFDKLIAEMRFQSSDWSNSNKTAEIGRALNAGFIIRGQLMKMGNSIYWTATMIDVNTAQILSSARTQVGDISEIFNHLRNFCSQMVSKIPEPNYLVGRWQGDYMNLRCVLVFSADGSIIVERYDGNVRDNRGTMVGTGTYSFDSAQIRIVLTLRNLVHSNFATVAYTGQYRIDESKNSFSLICEPAIGDGGYNGGGLYCYYSERVMVGNRTFSVFNQGYKSFIRIR